MSLSKHCYDREGNLCLSDDPNSRGVQKWKEVMYYDMPSDPLYFERWKNCRINGVARIYSVNEKNSPFIVQCAWFNMNLADFLEAEYRKWLADSWRTHSPSDWWFFIKDDFKRIFRGVNHILWKLYETNDFHGCLCLKCVVICDSEVMLLLPGNSEKDEKGCLTDYLTMVALMDFAIRYPFTSQNIDIDTFGIPTDLSKFLKFGATYFLFMLKNVSVMFIMDIPFFWDASERLAFVRKVDYFNCRHKSLCSGFYRHMVNRHCSSVPWEDLIVGDEVFIRIYNNRVKTCQEFIFRLIRNGLRHYLEEHKKLQEELHHANQQSKIHYWVPNESELERFITQSCPQFRQLYEWFREAIVTCSCGCSINQKATMKTIQTGFLSTTKHLDLMEGSNKY